jgi:hypothetical protein
VALSEAVARTHGGGRLANRGGRRGTDDAERRGMGVTDRQDQDKARPSGQRSGCERERERGRAAVGHQHVGSGGTVPGGTVQT